MRRTEIIKAVFTLVLPAMLLLGCSRKSAKDTPADGLEAITSVKELGLVEYRVRKIVKADDEGEWYKIGDRKILFSCTAYLKAGVDMSSFTVDDIVMDRSNGKVSITVPHASLLTINIPSSEVRLEYDQVTLLRSSFSAQERNLILRQGEKSIRDSVPSLGILEKAEENARLFFEALFSKMGFTTVEVIFK
ncbi:MAG: DUF4230 domain-containing protein [Bacteroidales bacterium]|nr:DUF4230 domain-containing protein [Bacteroidales bacterium]